ncbi:hypothetical protein N0V90_006510 [Kalmusia sp. IMI 367209]|nr:hypothetical protein N0V90_006510 [Kalmusia sp. IMI 367209]
MGLPETEANSRPTDADEEKHTAGEEKQTSETLDAPNGTTPSEKEVGAEQARAEEASGEQAGSQAEQPLREKEATGGAVQEVDGAKAPSQTADAEQQDGQEDESKYLSGFKLGVLSLGLCLTTFVIALDNTIIATAIPKITTVFNSLNDVGSLQPSFGKIYTYFDVKYTYLFALVLFEVGSVICAAATSSPMFIVGRAVAGAGAAALFSGGMTIIGYAVPLRKRAIYIAALSSMFGIASVVGPLLGGALTDNVSWRWCFWINLPFGAVSLAVVFFFFSNPERQYSHIPFKKRIQEVDLVGAVFLICAIVCLLLALQWGGQVYPWKDSKVWGNLLGFGLIIAVFIGIQIWQKDRATIPLRVIKQRTVLVSCIFTAFLSMALYTHIFYLPFYFQASKGTSAEGSGIRTIAYLCSITLSSIVIGGLITVIGSYAPFMWAGSAIFTIGAGMLYTLKVSSPAGEWIGYQVLAGLGAGASVQIPFVAVQVVTSEKDMPTANALVMFFNSLGGAIAISIAQNIFINSLAKEIPKYAPGVDPRIVINAGATYVRYVVPVQFLKGVLEAYTKAITTALVLSIATAVIACLVSFGMERKSIKGKKIIPGGGA